MSLSSRCTTKKATTKQIIYYHGWLKKIYKSLLKTPCMFKNFKQVRLNVNQKNLENCLFFFCYHSEIIKNILCNDMAVPSKL